MDRMATSTSQRLFRRDSPRASTATTVYACISSGSVAYHSNRRCAGLGRCTHEVKPMTPAYAQQIGKRACRKCY